MAKQMQREPRLRNRKSIIIIHNLTERERERRQNATLSGANRRVLWQRSGIIGWTRADGGRRLGRFTWLSGTEWGRPEYLERPGNNAPVWGEKMLLLGL